MSWPTAEWHLLIAKLTWNLSLANMEGRLAILYHICHVETDLQLQERSVHKQDRHLHPRLASRVLVLMHTFVGNLQVIKKPLPVADVGLPDDFQTRDSVLHAAIMHP